MINLIKGQRISINNDIKSSRFIIGFNYSSSFPLDLSIMPLSERNKLEQEEDFVFYNNPLSKDKSIRILDNNSNYKDLVDINLLISSNEFSRILFLLTIDTSEYINKRFIDVKDLKIDILDLSNNIIAQYQIKDLFNEAGIITIELYKRNNEWKLQTTGSGFNNGLTGILKEYGSEKVKVIEDETKNKKINLSKITLEKKGDFTKINLNKVSQDNKIHINLNWKQLIKKTAYSIKNLDLDLGCMYELNDGRIGIIQALGNAFGSKNNEPFIYLDKDDRVGVSEDGENLYILKPELIKRGVIFSFIYNNDYDDFSENSDFVNAEAKLTLKGIDNEITISLNNPEPYLTFCIGAYIENRNGEIKIQKINEYVNSHIECDKMFGFNFRWVSGSKD